MPVTVGRKFVYADDLAVLYYAIYWQALEETLTQDMATISSYLKKWKLKFNTTKSVLAAFHLYNKETRQSTNKLYRFVLNPLISV